MGEDQVVGGGGVIADRTRRFMTKRTADIVKCSAVFDSVDVVDCNSSLSYRVNVNIIESGTVSTPPAVLYRFIAAGFVRSVSTQASVQPDSFA